MYTLSNIFIVSYLFYAWSWDLPSDSPLKRGIKQFHQTIVWSGLWHGWSMFAPSPIRVESQFSVELTYEDESVEEYDEFRIHEVSRWQAFLNSRERKYQAVLFGKGEKTHRPALCVYVVKHHRNPSKKLMKTELIVSKRRIRLPSESEENEVERIVLWTITE